MSENYLIHYGILGQKWGVRRYQNEDGTLTEAGRKRYFDSNGNLTKKGLKEAGKYSKAFSKSDRSNTKKANSDFLKKRNKVVSEAIDAIKKADPSIGCTVLMSDGKMYTSTTYKAALDKGLDIEGWKYIFTGETLSETLDQMDVITKNGRQKEIDKLSDAYKKEYVSSIARDSGVTTQAGKEIIEAYFKQYKF